MEPMPTPRAPAARAKGAVTSLSPEAHMTGIDTAREMANAGAVSIDEHKIKAE